MRIIYAGILFFLASNLKCDKVCPMPLILDGRKARDFYKTKLVERVKALNLKPLLAIIQIGDNPESSIYIEQKKKFAHTIGVDVEHIKFLETATQEEVAEKIVTLNDRKDVLGIIIQLPLPAHLDKLALINTINPEKDVDGLTDENQDLLEKGSPRFIPATARGVAFLLDYYHIEVKGMKVAVLGRSRLVGHPLALLLKIKSAIVTVCHSQTSNTKEVTQGSDLVVVAIGRPEYVDETFIKRGAIVVDVGINSVLGQKLDEEIPKRKIVGDVKFKTVSTLALAISPVPGGVGPMTVLSLFDNLVLSAELKAQ
jgi:methylenetetrahydrofolate dehydrogenase (NADP+)/methenyltetrahydrofolate cyclohydrolase